MKKVAIAAIIVGLAVATVWLGIDNRRLRGQVGKAQHEEVTTATSDTDDSTTTAARSSPTAGDGDRAGDRERGSGTAALLGALNRAIEKGDADDSDRSDRRRRNGPRWMRMILGRGEGETDEQYRERVAPLITDRLSGPRDRMNEERTAFEQAANVTADQKAAMDQAFQDAYGELIDHANGAIQAGDLTPYKRNIRGVLSFAAGAETIVDGLDTKMNGILTPEQQAAMQESGFDLVEYMAVTAPWETLKAPPPEK